MKIRIIWLGKTRDPHLASLVQDFKKRIAHSLPIEITELKDVKSGDGARRIREEGAKILAALDSADRVVLLDAEGTLWNSPQWAAFFGNHLRNEPRRLTFVIGGFEGVSDAVKKRADKLWSLTPLTFTHDMTRVLVLEQIYRGLAILNNHPYSK